MLGFSPDFDLLDLELGVESQTFVCFFGFVSLHLESLGPKGEC